MSKTLIAAHVIYILFAVSSAAKFWLVYQYIGFPDGHVTAWGQVQRWLYPSLTCGSILLASLSAVELFRRRHGAVFLALLCLSLLAIVGAASVAEMLGPMYFDNGAGG